jgi:lipopolysaccharide export system permease protein
VILFRYIWREIYIYLLVIAIIFMSVILSNMLSLLLNKAASGDLTVSLVLLLSGLQIFQVLAYSLPLAFFISILMGLGRLHKDSEMVVMAACGLGLWRQTRIVVSMAFVVAMFTGWLTLWLNPLISAQLEVLKTQFMGQVQVDSLAPDRFQSTSSGKVIYVSQVSHLKHEASNVFIAELDSAAKTWDVVKANQLLSPHASHIKGQYLTLLSGRRYSGHQGSDVLSTAVFKQAQVNPILEYGHIKAMSFKRWLHMATVKQLLKQRHKSGALAELFIRFSIPVAMLISAFLATVLSYVDPRNTKGRGFLLALVLFFGYLIAVYISQEIIKKSGYSSAIWLVHVVMIMIISTLYLYRYGWRRFCYRLGCI